MRAGARLGWRVATAVVFGATAALAVIVSRGAPTHASLISAKAAYGGHATASASAVAAAAPQCGISRLRLSVGPGVRAAALIRYRLDFTNVSRLPCTMTGYPQVAADRNGVLVGGAAAQDTTVVAHRLLLAPGQTVHAALDATVPTPRCHPVRVSGLRVAPPGQSSARYLHRPLTACTARGQIYLHVRAVQAGTGARAGATASTAVAGG